MEYLRKMKKIKWIALWVSCVVSQVEAASPPPQKNWVVGVSGGLTRYKGEFNTDVSYTNVPNFPNTSVKEVYRDTVGVGGVLLGYQKRYYGWWLGGEANLDWYSPAKDRFFVFSDVAGIYTWGAKAHHEYGPTLGFSARLAYEMAPYFIAFMRAGVEGSHSKIEAEIAGPPVTYPFSLTMKKENMTYRYFVGMGFETPLWRAIAARLEYQYHSPGRSLEESGMIVDGVVNPLFSINTTPKIHLLRASLVWNIG